MIPQVMPLWISYSLYRFESNVRSASVVGMVGAGGIGVMLYEVIRGFQYAQTCAVMIIIIVFVTFIDIASARIRRISSEHVEIPQPGRRHTSPGTPSSACRSWSARAMRSSSPFRKRGQAASRPRSEALLGARLRERHRRRRAESRGRVVSRSRYEAFWGARTRADVLVAVGGGSAIDTAKLLHGGTPRWRASMPCSPLLAGGKRSCRSRARRPTHRRADHRGHRQRGDALGDASGTAAPRRRRNIRCTCGETWPEAALVDPALTLSAARVRHAATARSTRYRIRSNRSGT